MSNFAGQNLRSLKTIRSSSNLLPPLLSCESASFLNLGSARNDLQLSQSSSFRGIFKQTFQLTPTTSCTKKPDPLATKNIFNKTLDRNFHSESLEVLPKPARKNKGILIKRADILFLRNLPQDEESSIAENQNSCDQKILDNSSVLLPQKIGKKVTFNMSHGDRKRISIMFSKERYQRFGNRANEERREERPAVQAAPDLRRKPTPVFEEKTTEQQELVTPQKRAKTKGSEESTQQQGLQKVQLCEIIKLQKSLISPLIFRKKQYKLNDSELFRERERMDRANQTFYSPIRGIIS